MNLFGLIPAAWRTRAAIAVVIAALAGLGIVYLQIRHDAYNDGYQAADHKWQLELAAREAANKQAVEDAQATYRADLEVLEINKDKLNDLLVDNGAAAARDPDAGSLGIGADSVHRLNAIR